jgi:hypothetical protein
LAGDAFKGIKHDEKCIFNYQGISENGEILQKRRCLHFLEVTISFFIWYDSVLELPLIGKAMYVNKNFAVCVVSVCFVD